MGAECEKHGTDLVGHQFAEGGLSCPVCDVETKLEQAESRERELVKAGNRAITAWSSLTEHQTEGEGEFYAAMNQLAALLANQDRSEQCKCGRKASRQWCDDYCPDGQWQLEGE